MCALEGDDTSTCEDCSTDVGDDEVDCGAGSDSVDEESYWHEESSREHKRHTELWTPFRFVVRLETNVDLKKISKQPKEER